MEREFTLVVLLFFAYSFIGWLWETIYCSFKARHFVYRGFLVGPITPIYGFGIIGVLYLIEPYQNNTALLFLLATVLVTVLEYLTSLLLEKLVHASLWDYHDVPLNINGRVAVPVSLFWGVCCLLIVLVINPRLEIAAEILADRFGIFLPLVLIALTAFDLGITIGSLPAFQKAVKELDAAVQESKQTLKTNLKETRAGAKEQLDRLKATAEERDALDWLQQLQKDPERLRKLPKLDLQGRRILHNFPNLKLPNSTSKASDMRSLVKKIRQERKS